jgi:hypothetical protein
VSSANDYEPDDNRREEHQACKEFWQRTSAKHDDHQALKRKDHVYEVRPKTASAPLTENECHQQQKASRDLNEV